ncbi:BTAD domain-containing putative transcriptional regulator [Streptomyces sp. LARHCF249]
MRFGILGPLEVAGGTGCGTGPGTDDGGPGGLGADGLGADRLGADRLGAGASYAPQAAKLRVVLGTLLVRANEVVSSQSLIDELWPEAPPRTATTTLQVYVSHLRKTLRRADPENGRESLVTRRPGYLLRVGPDALDTMAFEDLSRRGHQALRAADFASAAELHRRALALWRGPLLSDTPHGPLLDSAAVRLGEARTTVLDERIRAELQLGLHRELVAELQELVAEHPMHEEFHAHLMVALYRCGRQAEALRVFAVLRRTLVEELGIEPGPASRRLQRRILEGDPDLSAAAGPRGDGSAGRAGRGWSPAPGALPPADPDFTGRSAELAELVQLLRTASAGGAVAVTGLPGTGKTALAVEAAHRAADAFPDGQVFLDLRSPTGPPPTGPEVLGRLARTPLTGRRMLLVLDHVTSETQVRPLLPLAGGCALLLTAGRVPAGLPGLRSVVLGPWRSEESRRLAGLFGGRAGTPAGTARSVPVSVPGPDAGALAEIAELCGRLPLAVRAAAAQLAARPHWSPATLADRLRDEGGRLDALRTGDVDVRARLVEAYAAAPDAQRRAFRLLALLPPGRFGARQAAAALDLAEPRAAAALDALADERLLAVDRDGCHLPELLRLLAVERLAEEEPPEVRRAAAGRVCRAYAAAAAARPGPLPDADALGLVRLARTAYEAGLWALTVRLTDAAGGWVQEGAEAAYSVALEAAVRCADRSAQARMERSLGDLAWQYRRLDRARELFAGALAHAREAGDEEEAGRALVGLAELRLDAGAAAEAAALLEPALAALSAPGRARGRYEASRARALLALAQDGPQGRETARIWFGECLELAGSLRDHRLEVYARRSLRALSGPEAGGEGAARRGVEIRPGLWRIRPAGVRA